MGTDGYDGCQPSPLSPACACGLGYTRIGGIVLGDSPSVIDRGRFRDQPSDSASNRGIPAPGRPLHRIPSTPGLRTLRKFGVPLPAITAETAQHVKTSQAHSKTVGFRPFFWLFFSAPRRPLVIAHRAGVASPHEVHHLWRARVRVRHRRGSLCRDRSGVRSAGSRCKKRRAPGWAICVDQPAPQDARIGDGGRRDHHGVGGGPADTR